MNTIEQKILELNQLVIAGKMMDAFEKFYHEDVQMRENVNLPVIGKKANRNRELEFLKNITEFRNASVEGMAIGDNISFVIWSYDYTHKLWGEKKYTQVSVQHWKDGQIIRENFFYGN
jgi:hypothetical protein